MHNNPELSPVDSFSSPPAFQELALGSEYFVATPSSTSSLDRAAPAVDAQHAAVHALISPIFDTELTIPPFRNYGNPQPYRPHPTVNHLLSSEPHHVRLSDPSSSRLPNPLDQYVLNALIHSQHVPVTSFTPLSGSSSGINPNYGSPPHQPIQPIPSSSSQYLSTHQSTDLGDLTLSQQIEFDTICTDYLTMLSPPPHMDSINETEATSPSLRTSTPPEDEAAAKAIMEVLGGILSSPFQRHSNLSCLKPLPVTK